MPKSRSNDLWHIILSTKDRILFLQSDALRTGLRADQASSSGGRLTSMLSIIAFLSFVGWALEARSEERLATAFAGTKAGQVRYDNGLKMKLVWCPPGTFTMGSSKDEENRWRTRRVPTAIDNQVRVTLTKGFWLGTGEVTQAQWRSLLKTTPWSGNKFVKEGDDFPATYVSWNDAIKFCDRLTENEQDARRLPSDWQYTLPTEAQWEYACRAGTTTAFGFGDDGSKLGDYAWFQQNTSAKGEKYAHQVGQKKSNAWGLCDMHGNVWEWCRDGYSDKLPGGKDPQVSAEGSRRIRRGGSWGYNSGRCRSASRERFFVGAREFYTGFRVAAVPSNK